MLRKNFYFPLTGTIYDRDEGEEYPLSDYHIRDNIDAITKQLDKDQHYNNTTMKDYFDDNPDVQSKLESIEWKLVNVNGTYYGCVEVELSAEIDNKGINDLKEWITGQNSDGLGEGFEQHEIRTDDGDIYVSMWDFNDYFIDTESEFKTRTGVDRLPNENTNPVCYVRNIPKSAFEAMNKAAWSLINKGMKDKATEMCLRTALCNDEQTAHQTVLQYVQYQITDNNLKGLSIPEVADRYLLIDGIEAMTPNGYIDLSVDDLVKIRNHESVQAHLGENGTEHSVSYDELCNYRIQDFVWKGENDNVLNALFVDDYVPESSEQTGSDNASVQEM